MLDSLEVVDGPSLLFYRISKAVESCVSVGPLAFTCMIDSPISSMKNATSTKGSDNGKECSVGHAAMRRPTSRKSIAGRRYSRRKRYSRNEDNPSSGRGEILV